MPLTVKILIGIQGSGKSTWSKDFIKNNAVLNYKRINRDDLRNMLDDGKPSNGNENFARDLKNHLIHFCLENNRSIILDDTHCRLIQLNELIDYIRSIAKLLKKVVVIEVINFNIDIDTCILRNRLRKNPLKDYILRKYQDNKDEINQSKLNRIKNYKIIEE